MRRRSPPSPGRRVFAAAPKPVAAARRRARFFAVRASRTIAAPAAAVFVAWTDARRRARWLSGVKPVVRLAVAPRFVRLTCEQGTQVEVTITARGSSRCTLRIEHTRLPTAEEAAQRKICWAQLLGVLQASLEA
jgi:hypothetical protein